MIRLRTENAQRVETARLWKSMRLDTPNSYLYNLQMNLRSKIPGASQLAQVFAVISILTYGWTTYRLLEKLPSWLFYLRINEIVANYSYTVVVDFLETLLFLSLVLVINLLLPRKFFMEKFVARGSLLAVFSLGYLIYLASAIGRSKSSQFPAELFQWTSLVFLMIVLLAILLPFLKPVQKVADEFADRSTVFLYIILPVTSLGILIFLFINLF
jgi:hypothetical protein